jgi:hypothetical protein
VTPETDAGTQSTSDKVVVHYADGRVAKGHTGDFNPGHPTFTLAPVGDGASSEPVTVRLADLKAVFFVKDFAGDPEYTEWKRFVEAAAFHDRGVPALSCGSRQQQRESVCRQRRDHRRRAVAGMIRARQCIKILTV